MSRKSRNKDTTKKPSRDGATISNELRELLNRTFPDGVVELNLSPDESYLADILPKLAAKLPQVRGAALLYERPPLPPCRWQDDDDDPFDDPPLSDDLSSSYYLFFLALAGAQFAFQTEGEGDDEDGKPQKPTGHGSIGCLVAVCMLAPLALIEFGQIEQYDDGSHTIPDIGDRVYSLDGVPIQPEVYVQESFGHEALAALTSLRGRLTKILEGQGIARLPAADAALPVPWLKASEEAYIGDPMSQRPISVQEAFFFRGP